MKGCRCTAQSLTRDCHRIGPAGWQSGVTQDVQVVSRETSQVNSVLVSVSFILGGVGIRACPLDGWRAKAACTWQDCV